MSDARAATPLALLLGHAQARPDAPAFIEPAAGTLSYAQLAEGAGAAAAWLSRQGVAADSVVALSLGSAPAQAAPSLELLYGAAWLGAAVLPLFPDVPAERRSELAARYGARLVEPARFRRGEEPAPQRADLPGRAFLMQFTSGTTGEPKAMRLSNEQFVLRSLRAMQVLDTTWRDRTAVARPFPSLVGMRYLLRLLCVGGAFVNIKFPTTRAALAEAVSSHGLTLLNTSPPQLRVLLRSEGERVELRALRVGGSRISAAEVLAAREGVCRNLIVAYGTNESGTLAILRPEDSPLPDGRVGRLLPDVKCQAVGGELRFRVPWMADGYVGNAAATSDRFRDGWFYPGDLGSVDAEGFVSLQGRVDDVINYGGIKVVPGEVEAVLLQHPGVADAAVAGVAVDGGLVPVAFVVTRGEASRTEVEDFCRQRIDALRVPAAFMRVREIPRNASGKVDRERLRRMPAGSIRLSARKP